MSEIVIVTTGQTGPVDTTAQAQLAAHIADTSDAHDASAISVLDTAGQYTATDVEAVLAELPSQFLPLKVQAFADGTSHPLSASFGTLAAAQARFPAAESLTDEWDWAAIMSVVEEDGGAYLPDTGNSYVINKPIEATWLLGDPGRTQIKQMSDNVAILKGTVLCRFENLELEYNDDQVSANTSANGIELLNVLMTSYIKGVSVRRAARGIYNNPAGYTFSTTFEDIDINGFSISGLYLGNAGGITGNVLSNVYVHNNPDGTTQESTEAPVYISGWDEGSITQLNIEWSRAPAALRINNSRVPSFRSVHFEGFEMTGLYGGLIETFNYSTGVTFEAVSVVDCDFLAATITSNTSALFKLTDGNTVFVNGFQARGNTVDITNLALVYAAGLTTGTARVIMEGAVRGEFTKDQIGDSTILPVVERFNGQPTIPTGVTCPLAAGIYYTPIATGDGAAASIPPEASMRGARFVVGRDCSIDRIACRVTVAGTTGALVRLGLFRIDPRSGALTLLVDGGTVSAESTGIKSVTVSQAVKAGWHILPVVAVQGAAGTRPTLTIVNGTDPMIGHADADTTMGTPLGGWAVTGITGAFPSTATGSVNGAPPRLVIRAA